MRIQAVDKINIFQLHGLELRERAIELEDNGDNVTGERLDPEEICPARMKDMEHARQKGIWKNICREDTKQKGSKIVKTGWIDT